MRRENNNISGADETALAKTASQCLNAARQFGHPRDALAAEHVDKDEKRAILTSWASDQFAIEPLSILRHYPVTERAVSYDKILEALKASDN